MGHEHLPAAVLVKRMVAGTLQAKTFNAGTSLLGYRTIQDTLFRFWIRPVLRRIETVFVKNIAIEAVHPIKSRDPKESFISLNDTVNTALRHSFVHPVRVEIIRPVLCRSR
jgi:hypothetical protein